MDRNQQLRTELLKREMSNRSTKPIKSSDSYIKKGILSGVQSALPTAVSTGTDIAINKPELLPMAGQGVGGYLGGFPGAVGGAMTGQAGKQAIDYLKTGKKPDVMDVGREGLVTGLIEGATRGAGKVFFRKQIADETLKNLGKQLGEMKEAMSNNPQLKAISQPILDTLETSYNALPEPIKRGKSSQVIRRWMNHLKSNPELSAKDLMLMEQDLGEAAVFGSMKKGVFQPADVPNPAMNKIAKIGRTQVSNIVDDLAEQGGQKGFKETSKKISKMLQRYPDFDPTKAYGDFGTRVVTSSLAGMATGNPLIGAGTYVAEKTLQSPEVRNALFRAVKNKASRAVGTGAKLTLSEIARKAK